MSVISVSLLGPPQIRQDYDPIHFSFSKIEALLYYLLVNGQVSREEMAGLLWADKDNQTAKKNLRNGIYQANKILGQELIVSPNRQYIAINPELDITCDLWDFKENPINYLHLYRGDFLKGFYLKDNDEFERWVDSVRQELKNLYTQVSYRELSRSMDKPRNFDVEANLKRLIAMDEFDEKNYHLLMTYYLEQGLTHKLIDTYYQLVNLLKRELGVSPHADIQALYNQALAKDRTERKIKDFLTSTSFFFGRYQEIQRLEAFLATVQDKGQSSTFLLTGGTGLGKRTLVRQVLANQTSQFQILVTACLYEETNVILGPWYTIIEALGDLLIKENLLGARDWQIKEKNLFLAMKDAKKGEIPLGFAQELLNLLKKASRRKPMVILVEDCHWMDQASLLVLHFLQNHLQKEALAFLLTKHLSTNPNLDQMLNQLSLKKQVQEMELKAFTREESLAFITMRTSNQPPKAQLMEKMVELAQGVPFFLEEFCQSWLVDDSFKPLTPAIKAKLALKWSRLSNEEQEMLGFLACLDEEISLLTLSQLLNCPYDQLLVMTEHLASQALLNLKMTDGMLNLTFRLPLLANYITEILTLSQKRQLHQQIAQGFEGQVQASENNQDNFTRIAHHYHLANQPLLSLSYQLKGLEKRLQFYHELFPLYSRSMAINDQESNQDIEDQFSQLSHKIEELGYQFRSSSDIDRLRLRLDYLRGRAAIRLGNYEQGIQFIHSVITLARQLENQYYLLEGYRQLLYYCIQTENLGEMHYYCQLFLEEAVAANNHEAIGISLRLQGLYYLMNKEVEKARIKLHQSIDYFSLTDKMRSRYAMQIGASLDYLAEIEQIEGNLTKAITYQEEAIALTRDKSAEPSVAIFYISLGISYFLQGDYGQAEKTFIEAKNLLKDWSLPWKEGHLEFYLALTALQKKDPKPAIELIQDKEHRLDRFSNPRDKGLMACLQAYLVHYQAMGKTLALDLTDSFDNYAQRAQHLLNPYRDKHLLEILETLRQKQKRD